MIHEDLRSDEDLTWISPHVVSNVNARWDKLYLLFRFRVYLRFRVTTRKTYLLRGTGCFTLTGQHVGAPSQDCLRCVADREALVAITALLV